ncbi:MAG TPA: hypothetical protein VF574_07630 [Allosphingosinicella sp.]|jgi:hypothetical protein
MRGYGLAICALALAAAGPAFARAKVAPAQIDAWAACAVEKNSADVKWLYIVRTDQSGLTGRALDGADAYGFFAMTRDCVPEGTSFDGKLINALSTAALTRWVRDPGRESIPRITDPWADCMVGRHRVKAAAYLAAYDLSFAGGPRIMVDGADPMKAIFDPAPECDSSRPAGAERKWTDLYARFNYLLRVKPRPVTNVIGAAGGDKR